MTTFSAEYNPPVILTTAAVVKMTGQSGALYSALRVSIKISRPVDRTEIAFSTVHWWVRLAPLHLRHDKCKGLLCSELQILDMLLR